MITEATNLDRAFARYQDLKSKRTNEPAWLAEIRHQAMERFQSLGFPTMRDEEWKYTNPVAVSEGKLIDGPTVDADAVRAHALYETAPIRLVLANGRWNRELSDTSRLPSGVTVSPLSLASQRVAEIAEAHLGRTADHTHHAFGALNTALFEDAFVVHIPKNVVVEDPILLLSYTDATGGEIALPRVLVVAETNSQCTLIEAFVGSEDAATYTVAVSEYVLAEGANIDHYKVTLESTKADHIALHHAELSRNAVFSNHNLALGGRLTRNDIGARLGGEACEATLNGLVIATGNQHVDNHTSIDHAMPHCPSHEVYKTILDGHSTGVFNGKIFVRLDAQKTDAKQTNKTLLLSDDATIYTKPQLEILADDVKCTHGATVGQLDDKQMFYLRSRGIGPVEARALLIYAFAGEIVSEIKVEALREVLDGMLLKELPTLVGEVEL